MRRLHGHEVVYVIEDAHAFIIEHFNAFNRVQDTSGNDSFLAVERDCPGSVLPCPVNIFHKLVRSVRRFGKHVDRILIVVASMRHEIGFRHIRKIGEVAITQTVGIITGNVLETEGRWVSLVDVPVTTTPEIGVIDISGIRFEDKYAVTIDRGTQVQRVVFIRVIRVLCRSHVFLAQSLLHIVIDTGNRGVHLVR